MRQVLDQVPLSLLQFHGRESAAYCRQFGLPYIKAINMRFSTTLLQPLKSPSMTQPEFLWIAMSRGERAARAGRWTGAGFQPDDCR